VTARVEVERELLPRVLVDGLRIDVARTRLGAVRGLPPREPDTLLVVSRVIAEALPARDDLVFPDGLVRDACGVVVGARILATVATRLT